MGFINADSYSINRTVQGIKRGSCYKCEKHTRFACLVCHQRVAPQHRKISKNTYYLECWTIYGNYMFMFLVFKIQPSFVEILLYFSSELSKVKLYLEYEA